MKIQPQREKCAYAHEQQGWHLQNNLKRAELQWCSGDDAMTDATTNAQ